MQTSLMFLDLTARGVMPNIQKVAIKMPKGQSCDEAGESSEFSDIISALMAMTPENLEKSLDRMDWVKVEGELSEYVPLIDLSGGDGNASSVWRELLWQMGPEINPQNNPAALASGDNASWDTQTVEQIKSTIETVQKEGFSLAEKGTIENGGWLTPTADKIDLELQSKGDGEIISLDNNDLGKDGGGSRQLVLSNARPKWDPANPPHQPPEMASDSQQLADIQSKTPSGGEFKPSHAETRSIKETSIDILKQGQTEGMNLKTGDSRPPIKIESTDNGHQEMGPAQPFGQQFAQTDQQEEDAFTRQKTKEPIKFDSPSSNHKPEQLEVLTNSAGDAEEAALYGRHIQRGTIHPALHRTSISSHRSVEHISEKSEWTPPASEIQSNVIRQIVQRMSLRTQGSQSSMSIKLKPEFLGNLHLQVSTDNQQVVVRMATESAAVKEMIEQGLQHLKSELQHHGLQIDRFDVLVANDNDETNLGQDTAAFQQAPNQRRQGEMRHLDHARSEASDQTAGVQQSTDASSEIDYFA